jgi:hypothetical protein
MKKEDEMEKDETKKWLDDLRKRLMETHSPEELEAMKVKVDTLESMMRMVGENSMHDDDTDEEGHHHHEHSQSVFAGGFEA